MEEYCRKRGFKKAILDLFHIYKGIDGSMVIPVYDKNGKFLFNKYRLFNKEKKYTYDKGGTMQLYGIHLLKEEHQEVVLTEGETQVIGLWQEGIPAVSSTGGASSWSNSWSSNFNGRRIKIIFDNDIAGRNGSNKIYRFLKERGVDVSLLQIEDAHDLGDIFERGDDIHKYISNLKSYIPEQIKKKEQKTAESQDAIDIVARARQYPIDNLIKVNNDGFALCIYHNEKTPSMKVYEDNHAFAFCCGKKIDSIDIVMEKLNCTFKEAVKRLI